jgi:hypothetical protein
MVYVKKQIHTCVSYEGVMTSGLGGGGGGGQISLNHFMDDCHFNYVTNWKYKH